MRRASLLLIVLTLAIAGVGCPCTRSAVNASPELRWWLFSSFGASKICPEMLKRGVPLKLPQLGPASVGRFFPSQCHVQVDDARKAIVMTASGTGYVLLPFATLEIEGFRQSTSAVAAFRFAAVGESYAAQMGSARNVGVIGAAFFAERGDAFVSQSELRLRDTASPFPADPRFAQPPRR